MKKSPLQGIRVIDMTHDWAGPHCTKLLADYGAEVILVEYPKRLGLLRGGRTENKAYDNQTAWFQVNRSKYTVTLDLKNPTDKDIMADLIKSADVFIENGRAGVVEKLGFGYEQAKAMKPDLIMLSMPAYGCTGPYAGYGAYGAALEVMSGVQNLTAYGPDQKTERIREMDIINGIGAACAIMTALVYRQETGNGQHIDFSQLELPSHALLGEHLLEFTMNGTHAPALGNRHRYFAPQGCYPCKGEDAWVTLSVRSDSEWQRFCDVVGQAGWKTDTRFATAPARRKNHDELDRLISEWTRERSHYEAMMVLQKHAIPSGAVLNMQEVADDPHLKVRNYFESGVGGSDKPFVGVPFKLSETPGQVRWKGPGLGEYNEHVVCKLLGRPKSDITPITEKDVGTAYDPE